MLWVGLQSVIVSFPGHTHFKVFGPGFGMHFIFGNHLIEEEIVFLRLFMFSRTADRDFRCFYPHTCTSWWER